MIDWAEAIQGAPRAPGVYFFLDDGGNLLYVGKAGNIHRRMGQHALTRPVDGWINPRYSKVSRVAWEETRDEASAAAREADLIVALRPPFNANTAEGRWNFICVTDEGESLRFTLSPRHPHPPARIYGAFPHLGKGVSLRPAIACSDGYTAFLRLLWAASKEGKHVPSSISRSAPDGFTVKRRWDARIHRFLSGQSLKFLEDLDWSHREPYMRPALARDLELAGSFFVYGPLALRTFRLRHGKPSAPPLERPEIEELLTQEVAAVIGDFGVDSG